MCFQDTGRGASGAWVLGTLTPSNIHRLWGPGPSTRELLLELPCD